MQAGSDTQRSPEPSYGYSVRLEGVSYDAARQRAVDALRQEGFGVLTEIDVKATLQQKLGEKFRRYTILGACNPRLAHRGLEADLGLGLLLPCNVCVWEDGPAAVVAILRPQTMLEIARNPVLEPVAREADERLRRVIEALRAGAAH